jgi:hypothetical protein
MKKLLLTLTVVSVTAVTAFAQGRVSLNNTATFNASDAVTVGAQHQVTGGGATGNGIGGNEYSVQLVWVAGTGFNQATFDAANPTLGNVATGVGAGGSLSAAFFANTGSTATGAGFFDAGAVPNPVGTSMPAGQYTMQVYAWYNVGFSTYAASSAAGKNVGKSALFLLSAAAPPGPVNSTVFPAFQVTSIPEPSSLALAGLGAVAMLLIRRKK